MKPTVKFITLGCRVNQAESEALACFGRDCESTLPLNPNGICVINTCTVTQKAAMQSRQAIRKTIRENPGATIIVTGCYAQSAPDVIERIEGVDYVIGQTDKHRIFEIISTCEKGDSPIASTIWKPIRQSGAFEKMPAPASGSRSRPFLKVQDGCDAFCTYCIVPHTRGRSRSLPLDQAVSEYEQLIAAGAEEIVLTGIHLGRYGLDLDPRTSLLELLRQLEKRGGTERIRLSSLESTEITDELLDHVAGSKKICPHFHVPLQSGDRSVLERMHRPYSPEQYAGLIRAIHERLPDAAIGADVLVGFPGETVAAFDNTRNLIRSLPISYLQVFPFSPRHPAPAAGYPEQVPAGTMKDRCLILRDLGRAKREEFYRHMLGKHLDVIIESRTSGNPPRLKGLSSNYIPVYIENSDYPADTRVRCRITAITKDRSVRGVIDPPDHPA